MKVFLVVSTTDLAVNFRGELLRELVRRGHEVVVYVGDWSEDAAGAVQAEYGVEVRAWPVARAGMNPFSDLRALWHLYREFRRGRPDVVFSCQAKSMIWGGLAASLAKVPHNVGMLEGLGFAFTPEQGGVYTKKQQGLQRVQVLLYRVIIPRLDYMIVLNPDDRKDLIDAYKIRFKAITVLGGIGLDLDKFRHSPPPLVAEPVAEKGKLRFIFIGRLLAEKGIREYVAAASSVKKSYPNAIFTVLGGLDKDNPGGLTQRELDTLISDSIIDYPGFVTDVPKWLAASDVFVLPSYYREGVPRSTQEAMSVGRAVITTDVPGCRETVEDGVNGFLIPPWQPDALANKMIWMIEHPDRVVEMGRQSRLMAEQIFDVHEVNQRLCSLLGV